MFQNNPLLAQLKQQLNEQIPRAEGIVKKSGKNYAFLETDSQKNYFIPPNWSKKLLHGDRISGVIKPHSNNKNELIEPETLINSVLQTFAAKTSFKNGEWYITPKHPFCHEFIKCTVNKTLLTTLKSGDYVIATLTGHALDKESFSAHIDTFIAPANTPFIDQLLILANHHLPTNEPVVSSLSIEADVKDPFRQDLSAYPFLTIDNKNTLDIDDAIHVIKQPDGSYLVYIAIADPDNYVVPNSEIDKIAQSRAFTHYLPKFTIPMLPSELSYELCSLNLDKVRPALVCQMIIFSDGTLHAPAEFYLAYVHSKAKLTYHDVSDYLEQQSSWQPDNEIIQQQLLLLNELAGIRNTYRKKHNIVYKEQVDYRFAFDDNEQVTGIVIEEKRSAHRIIEEMMIASNLCAANYLNHHLGFGIFVTHPGFDRHLLKQLIPLLAEYNLHFTVEQLSSLEGFIQLKNELAIINDNYLNSRIRRFQAYAEMSTQPAPHFGLGFEFYANWTAPLRKYSDLINHRLIKQIIMGKPSNEPEQQLIVELLERRKKQRICNREINNTLYMSYFSHHIGTQFEADIMDMNRGGIRVRMPVNGALAFIPYSKMTSNNIPVQYDLEKGSIVIDESKCYRQGDNVNIQIIETKENSLTVIAKLI